ncbi:hypothetical protein [Sulfolobus tengchongensis spindle-shaped virus 3]|nr:hypothetical protein [Sulfolobus tengchongensis spindle-shaped virus 3]
MVKSKMAKPVYPYPYPGYEYDQKFEEELKKRKEELKREEREERKKEREEKTVKMKDTIIKIYNTVYLKKDLGNYLNKMPGNTGILAYTEFRYLKETINEMYKTIISNKKYKIENLIELTGKLIQHFSKIDILVEVTCENNNSDGFYKVCKEIGENSLETILFNLKLDLEYLLRLLAELK